MSKKSGWGVAILLLLAVGVIFAGYRYSADKKEELASGANTKENSKTLGKIDEKNNNTYEKNRDHLSVLDYITYLHTKDGKEQLNIAFYGQLSNEEHVPKEIEDTIQTKTDSNISSNRAVKKEINSYQLAFTELPKEVKEAKASVLFYFMPSLGDKVKDISIADSESYLAQSIESLKKSLPNTLIVLVTPHPMSSELQNYNSRTLDYRDYMKSGIKVTEEMKIPLFDLHTAFEKTLEEDNKELDGLLKQDGILLNTEGEQLTSRLVEEFLKEPIDTTGGIQ